MSARRVSRLLCRVCVSLCLLIVVVIVQAAENNEVEKALKDMMKTEGLELSPGKMLYILEPHGKDSKRLPAYVRFVLGPATKDGNLCFYATNFKVQLDIPAPASKRFMVLLHRPYRGQDDLLVEVSVDKRKVWQYWHKGNPDMIELVPSPVIQIKNDEIRDGRFALAVCVGETYSFPLLCGIRTFSVWECK